MRTSVFVLLGAFVASCAGAGGSAPPARPHHDVTTSLVTSVTGALASRGPTRLAVLPLDADGTFDVPGFLEGYYLDFERVADRRFPFEHLFPLRMTTVTSLAIPDGRKLDEVARKPEQGESRFGQWQRKVRREDGGWEIRFDFVASEDRFGPEDYREFSEFQRKTIDAVEQPLLLQE